MVRSLSTSEILDRIDELLEAKYVSADLGNKRDPLDELIFILLSLQTNASGFNKSYERLRRAFPRWEQILEVSESRLVTLLRPFGLAKQKAGHLRKILHLLCSRGKKRKNKPTLDFLRRLEDDKAEEYLRSLPGVGPKTARCVLMYSLNRKVFPVDVNVYRIFTRLGLAAPIPIKRSHDALQKIVPEDIRKRLHINLVHHGRQICTPTSPKCGSCVLASFCKTTAAERGRVATPKRPTAIDLFAGAGILSGGFESSGWSVALAVEWDRNAAQTYRLNHPGVPVLEKDVKTLTATEILRATGLRKGQISAVIGGPPCQGYSAAGKRVASAEKNFLYRPFVSLAKKLEAKALVIENVPGVNLVDGTRFVRRILAHSRRAGFSTDAFLLDALNYGVPQKRRRYIFIGLKDRAELPPEPLAITNGGQRKSSLPKTPTVRDVLAGLPPIRANGGKEVLQSAGGPIFNHVAMKHGDRVVRRLRRLKRGKGPISYKRLSWAHAGTLVAGHRALPVHPSIPRAITVREAARIQTIPDSYRFLGPRGEQPLQVANAVPFRLAATLGGHLIKLAARRDKSRRALKLRSRHQ
jgi:DNA (cytosine-5)-methyltransferase 1